MVLAQYTSMERSMCGALNIWSTRSVLAQCTERSRSMLGVLNVRSAQYIECLLNPS